MPIFQSVLRIRAIYNDIKISIRLKNPQYVLISVLKHVCARNRQTFSSACSQLFLYFELIHVLAFHTFLGTVIRNF